MNNKLEKIAREYDDSDPLESYVQMYIRPDLVGMHGADSRGDSLGLCPSNLSSLFFDLFLNPLQKFGWDAHMEGKEPWFHKGHEPFEALLAPFVGAMDDPDCPEVTIGNTLSVNNCFLLLEFLRHAKMADKFKNKPVKILTIDNVFPSDHHSMNWALSMINNEPRLWRSPNLIAVEPDAEGRHDMEEIKSMMNKHKDEIALCFFPGLSYVTGQRFDIEFLAEAAHEHELIIGFDLAHAAGNFPLKLHDWEVDFATFCNYKYNNGGPGCVGGMFTHRFWTKDNLIIGIPGWWGEEKNKRFTRKGLEPAKGVRRFLASNDQVANSIGLRAHLENVKEVGITNIFEKHEAISGFFYDCLSQVQGVEIVSPESWNERGCQLSFSTSMGVEDLLNKLQERGVSAEDRDGNVRAAFVGYNTYEEVLNFCKAVDKSLN